MGDKMFLGGQTALVTGASRGIGRGIALAMASAGADIVVNHHPGESAEEVAGEIRKRGRRVLACGADVGKAAAWLASDDADYITGTTLYVDGGMLLYPGFRIGG